MNRADAIIRYEDAFMFVQSEVGLRRNEVSALRARKRKAVAALIEQMDSGVQGWLALPDDRMMRERLRRLVDQKRRFEHCLVIGIGGSDLGARAVYHALAPRQGTGSRLLFAGATTDPDALARILEEIDPRTTLVNIISKSGDTLEPMAAFYAIRDVFRQKLGSGSLADHIVATTDEHRGSLREIAEQEGYATLPVAGNVGGRFSVLTDVGLFPLAMAGISLADILAGARIQRDALFAEDATSHPAVTYAAHQYLALTKHDARIHVLMPYAEALREFGQWYRQLWAESLGKAHDRQGRLVHVGPTPIAALGPTDQHSQLQLYMEGPMDKVVTFVEVGHFHHDRRVSEGSYAGTSFERLMHTQRQATATALREAGRPNATLFLPRISPVSMGSLIMFFEIATVLCGEFMGINPYDQPGVEQGKRETLRLLGRLSPLSSS